MAYATRTYDFNTGTTLTEVKQEGEFDAIYAILNGTTAVDVAVNGDFDVSGAAVIVGDIKAVSHTYTSAQTRYLSMDAGCFVPDDLESSSWSTDNATGRGNTTLWNSAQFYSASMNLPQGAIVTGVKLYYYLDDDSDDCNFDLYRNTLASATIDTMATGNGTGTAGYDSVEDTTITNATIDNSTYSYRMALECNPSIFSNRTSFLGVVVTYTVTVPLP